MAKAYWIAHVDVHDPDGYKSYLAANAEVYAKYGARFLVRNGTHVVKEGASRARTVVLEFKDYATALACYESPEYAAAMAKRLPHSTADVMIVEGYDGPQPG
ncbi:DUF1330 domain-containing protein [Methylovirgula sp. 4M-Z18]|uniref:DUF1330 domain-containing protein n=1 Tax=Methylovirgula sp. 4M-Z18 TaxID=2293567 RepID=UPI000E2F76E4|nr:DUF1330 domain-containing protein [Methylovirgula sp. 4M-Z18]RFB79554.1 DUF1330 domain-containing protein [Methylovirgula sp. 4M-Z18]